MRHTFLAALALLLAWPDAAAAQTAEARAIAALSAVWRPVATADLGSAAALEAACAGAIEEIAEVEGLIPTEITSQSLARVRGARGLTIIPGDDGATAFFFPPGTLPWFASGLGVVAVLDEGQGLLGVRDAARANIGLQLGRAGGRPVLRVRPPEGALLTFVGCAPTSR
jgi:hypothetical protein